MKRPTLRHPIFAIAAIATASAAVGVYAFANRTAPEESEPRELQAVSRAVFANDRLWLLNDNGSLASLKADDAKPERMEVGGRALDICKSAGSLLAIVSTDKDHWTIKRSSPVGWSAEASIQIGQETFSALACTPDGSAASVVSNRHLFDIEGSRVRAIPLTEEIKQPTAIGTALIDGDSIWVGFNVGEWGGGLRRIDRGDGTIENIQANRSRQLCGGPLNTECDPVNGIVSSPSNPSCIIAAIGLVHMMSHGRIVEVCGKDVRRLYFKPFDPQPPYGKPDDGEPSSTIAFFGLARSANKMWAVGIDGLYSFDGSKPPQFRPLPKFENRGGYRVSFDVPGIVLVMTDVNQRRSMSGAVPIMAPR